MTEEITGTYSLSAPSPQNCDQSIASSVSGKKSGRTRSSSVDPSLKKKKRSQSKDSKKSTRRKNLKEKALHDGGYGSDGALDDAKNRVRERRKASKIGITASGDTAAATTNTSTTAAPSTRSRSSSRTRMDRSKSPISGLRKRLQSKPVEREASLSPVSSRRRPSIAKRITGMFGNKAKHGDSVTMLHDSNSTCNYSLTSEQDQFNNNQINNKSFSSIGSTAKKSVDSTAGLATESSGRRKGKRNSTVGGEPCDDERSLGSNSTMSALKKNKKKLQGSKSRRGRSAERANFHDSFSNTNDNSTVGSIGAATAGTLEQQLEREQERTKRLRKKVASLKKDLANALSNNTQTTTDGVPVSADKENTIVSQGTGDMFELEKKAFKRQLQEKDKRIAELQRLVDYGGEMDVFHSNDSVGSIGSSKSGGDAIWNRLQALLNQTRADLAEKEELLQAQTASLMLQTHRVEELERELELQSSTTVKKYKDECLQLQDEKEDLEKQLLEERREAEEKMRKKDESLAYFRDELMKLKQAESQRNLSSGASVHSNNPLDSSSHSASSVTRAFSALVSPSLWSKDKVVVNGGAASSIASPRIDLW